MRQEAVLAEACVERVRNGRLARGNEVEAVMAIPEEAKAQIMEALARGDKMAAIRLARQISGGSLKDVVAFVDTHSGPAARAAGTKIAQAATAAADRHGQHSHAQSMQRALSANDRKPTVAMGDAPGSLRWVMLVLGLLALAVWVMLG